MEVGTSKPIDCVYVLGGGSHINNDELKYSLRSIDKHLSNVGKIVLVGKKPSWARDVVHIPAEDENPCKETNIYRKVLLASQSPEVSDNFLFFNDDHFILRDFDAEQFPFYYKGQLLEVLKKLPPYNKYSQCVHRTAYTLRSLGLPEKNFDTHTPIIYNKEKFASVMPKYDWEPRFSFVVKSLYANTVGIEGVKEPDCKINDPAASADDFLLRIQGKNVFSIGNGAIGPNLYKVWNSLYPLPSPWEVPF